MIGVFDSGMGGLSTLRELSSQLPDDDLLFLGDTARGPYGAKSAATVSRFAIENVGWMLGQGARMVVLTCHTAAGVAVEQLRSRFPVPIFDSVAAAVDEALARPGPLRIGVLADHTTIDCGVYQRMIAEARPEAAVFAKSCPLLGPLSEEEWIKKPETRMIVKKYLHPLKVRRIDTLILGNPGYRLLAPVIRAKIGPRVRLVGAAGTVVNRVRRYLAEHPDLDHRRSQSGRIRVVVTDLTSRVQKAAESILKPSPALESIPPSDLVAETARGTP